MKNMTHYTLLTLMLSSLAQSVSATTVREDTYIVWLQICTVIGAQAEQIVRARDIGMPLTRILALQNSDIPFARRFLTDITTDIYTWRYWDRVRARQEAETRCMALAPR
jgi:hypothetical protein